MLFDEHQRELLIESAIDPQVIAERGYRTAGLPTPADEGPRLELEAAGIPGWAIRERWNFPGLIIPWYRATGERTGIQYKPRSPITIDGKPRRYASPRGQASTIDVHPRWTVLDPGVLPPIRDVKRPLHITEGVKKADSLTSKGLVTAALTGVFSWRNSHGTLGDWEDIPVKGRVVVVVFDADCVENRNVLAAMKRLGRWLKSKGATVKYVYPPAGGPKGIDDWFASGRSWTDLEQHGAVPELLGGDGGRFTDAAMAEEVAAEALEGRYAHTTGMGWLEYQGTHWARCDEATALEAVRQHHRAQLLAALDGRRAALAAGDDKKATRYEALEDGWRPYQSAGKLAAVLKLASGIQGVHRRADEFDTDPDVLNTPGGLIHVPTLSVEPHSPDQLVTKITAVRWNPDADNEAWKTALLAVPEGAEEHLRTVLGQALTGHPGRKLTMLTAGGNNGKTAIMSTIHGAFGSYAMLVPNEILLNGATKGAATPEKMTLRGLRLAYIEETPEDRHLNTQAVKSLVETPVVSGRYLFKDTTEFRASHTFVLNTNYPPVVVETDDGTWRRMEVIPFPYRFRTEGDGRGEWRPGDRPGDATIKDRLATVEAMEAALAWAVQGAHAWYQERNPVQPAVVLEATRSWRHTTDTILRFLDATCVFEPSTWVTTEDLYGQFKIFCTERGLGQPSETTFMSRLLGHTGLPGPVTKCRRRASVAGFSRPSGWVVVPDGKIRSGVVGLGFQA
jgi:P4 family phage/plasmid primase-like protien